MFALALALPMAAFADTTSAYNQWRHFNRDSNGMAFSGDQLVSVTGLGGPFSAAILAR